MKTMNSSWVKPSTLADAAIDGLFGGLFAGLLMGLTIILAGVLVGESAGAVLARFSTGQTTTPLAGGLLHLAVSGVYGVFFSLLLYLLPMRLLNHLPGWLLGFVYSAVLLFVAVSALLPGLNSPLMDLPLFSLALGHAVYGLALGWRVSSMKRG